jgi:HEAT repeat protein
MRQFVAAAILVAVAIGCNRKTQPTMVHGKPVDFWLTEITGKDPKARKKAVSALGLVGPADPAAIPAVIAALKDNDASVRNEAALALLNLGSAASEAVPALTETLKDPDGVVRASAAKAIDRINGKK